MRFIKKINLKKKEISQLFELKIVKCLTKYMKNLYMSE